MTDIVERLRSPANVFYEYAADNGAFLREAADEIERLRDVLRFVSCDCEPHECRGYGMGNRDEYCEHWKARCALGEKE